MVNKKWHNVLNKICVFEAGRPVRVKRSRICELTEKAGKIEKMLKINILDNSTCPGFAKVHFALRTLSVIVTSWRGGVRNFFD